MRKEFVTIIIIAFIAYMIKSNLISEVSANYKTGEDVQFYIVSDPHHLSKKLYDDGEAFKTYVENGDKLLQYTGEILDAVKDEIAENKPDFLVVSGDLTCNGARENHIDLAKKFREIEQLGTSVFVVPGNHDMNNARACYFEGEEAYQTDNVSDNDFIQIYDEFGFEEAISRDENSLSYLAAPYDKLWLLMLDSTKNYPYMGGEISESTLDWMLECAEMARKESAKIVAVMHHSLVDHSEIINDGYTIDYSMEVSEYLIQCDIDIVLTGHIHLQDIKVNEIDGNKIYDIATSSLAVYPNQFGEMNYSIEKGYEYTAKRLNMETYAVNHNILDRNLLNFEDFSEDFFITNCCQKQRDYIEELEYLTNDEKAKLFKIVSEMNKMFFSGYRNEALRYITEDEDFRILEGIEPCFLKSYVMAILEDDKADNNILKVPIDTTIK
jgi:3',5'-cyclic AMP phosphodiesterase CpdA